jgi:hypothetical protein
MENVFDNIAGITADEGNVESNNAGVATDSSLGEEFDLDLGEIDIPEENGDLDEGIEEGGDTSNVEDLTPTNNAFKQMRTQNKEFQDKLNALDAIAKASGLKDVDDLIAKSKEAQIRAEAKEQGIPEAVAKELAEMREFREEVRQKEIQNAYALKEQTFVNNLESFISLNKLSNDAVSKLSDNLVKDGFSNEYLMQLPKTALNKILSAYTSTGVQQNLERKDAIQRELPVNQTSKVDTNGLLKEIDDLARQFAGK